MVATKLSEVAGKGWEWYSSPGENSTAGATSPPSDQWSPSSYWTSAQNSVQTAMEQTYSAVGNMMSSAYPTSPAGSVAGDGPVVENLPVPSRRTSVTNSIFASQKFLNLFRNPYISVRGGGPHHVESRASMLAVRSFLSVVPAAPDTLDQASEASSSNTDSLEGSARTLLWLPLRDDRSRQYNQTNAQASTAFHGSSAETASQLAEGTLRAFRDVALDEAVELHEALRYWAYRWERPILSWLEAGPTVWFSKDGYRHQEIGLKVSRIQAVLARRCATIGELQQHLLLSGWQRGVAQWGVLGDGGEWATVTGVDGTMRADSPQSPQKRPTGRKMQRNSSIEGLDKISTPSPASLPTLRGPTSNVSNLPQRSRHDALYYTHVFVQNDDGGRILIDDPALAEWAIDALSIVRRQLFRAANGHVVLPYTENWSEGDDQSLFYDGSTSPDADNSVSEEGAMPKKLPLWASLKTNISTVEEEGDVKDEDGVAQDAGQRVTISNLPLMVSEVSEILDSMEAIMALQRARRLEKLQAPLWIRRNWYISAAVLPPLSYFLYQVVMTGNGLNFLKNASQSLTNFFREHVVEPIVAIYDELTRGTESISISDHEARKIAIENLQKMIRSWLDETHPEMPLKERYLRAEMMDIALIEARKEEAMKSLLELNSVIRMSLIEAQFIKKEMMNALLALDEMRASTNFNMNLAAVTPFVLMAYMAKRTFQFVFYATLRMGKSREETYGSFLQILTEIERLLVMRDNPPTPIRSKHRQLETGNLHDGSAHDGGDTVLNADDLGMLMLHIHELKTILWKDRRRFTPSIIRSVAEDLAELAGERGAVSVRQQLHIIGRMCRTYPFLKVVSSAMVFEYLQL